MVAFTLSIDVWQAIAAGVVITALAFMTLMGND